MHAKFNHVPERRSTANLFQDSKLGSKGALTIAPDQGVSANIVSFTASIATYVDVPATCGNIDTVWPKN